MKVDWMVGRRLEEVDASVAPGQWLFRFDGNCLLNAEGLWRVVREGRVAVAARDHGSGSDPGSPRDAGAAAFALLKGAAVEGASYDDGGVGDLRVAFSNSIVLEVLTSSSAFENWTLVGPTGALLVGTGGGGVASFEASGNG